jgi:hypothetical protein
MKLSVPSSFMVKFFEVVIIEASPPPMGAETHPRRISDIITIMARHVFMMCFCNGGFNKVSRKSHTLQRWDESILTRATPGQGGSNTCNSVKERDEAIASSVKQEAHTF